MLHPSHNKLLTETCFDTLAEALADQGFFVLPEAMDAALISQLLAQACSLQETILRPAGIGREVTAQHDQRIRGDKISWLQPDNPGTRAWLDCAEQLRQALNHRLYLGLFDYECHFACYEPGAFYARHKDAFAGRRNRVVSTVLYLNRDWRAEDGGELLLYEEDETTLLRTIMPESNTLVVFLSERFPHEVLPARRSRYSVTGWFRVREQER